MKERAGAFSERSRGRGEYKKHLEKGKPLQVVELGQKQWICRDEGHQSTKKTTLCWFCCSWDNLRTSGLRPSGVQEPDSTAALLGSQSHRVCRHHQFPGVSEGTGKLQPDPLTTEGKMNIGSFRDHIWKPESLRKFCKTQ